MQQTTYGTPLCSMIRMNREFEAKVNRDNVNFGFELFEFAQTTKHKLVYPGYKITYVIWLLYIISYTNIPRANLKVSTEMVMNTAVLLTALQVWLISDLTSGKRKMIYLKFYSCYKDKVAVSRYRVICSCFKYNTILLKKKGTISNSVL